MTTALVHTEMGLDVREVDPLSRDIADRELVPMADPPAFRSRQGDLHFRAALAVAELLRLVPETRVDLVALQHELVAAAEVSS